MSQSVTPENTDMLAILHHHLIVDISRKQARVLVQVAKQTDSSKQPIFRFGTSSPFLLSKKDVPPRNQQRIWWSLSLCAWHWQHLRVDFYGDKSTHSLLLVLSPAIAGEEKRREN